MAVLSLMIVVTLTACTEPIEERAATAFADCAAEFGLDGGMIGIVRGPNGSFAITAPDLPEPAASECRRRMNLILQSE